MFFDIRRFTVLANLLLIFWLIWHMAFIKGYQDAVNDLEKKGYRFQETVRAFP